MKYILIIFLSFFFLYLNFTLPPIFSVNDSIQPDLFIIIVNILSLNFERNFVYIFVFIFGFLTDSLTGTYLGFHSIFFLLISFFTFNFSNYFYKNKLVNRLFLIFACDFIYRLILTLIFFEKIGNILNILAFLFYSPVYTTFLYYLFELLYIILKFKKDYVQR